MSPDHRNTLGRNYSSEETKFFDEVQNELNELEPNSKLRGTVNSLINCLCSEYPDNSEEVWSNLNEFDIQAELLSLENDSSIIKLISVLAFIFCISRLERLLELQTFGVDHLKKCMTLYDQIFRIIKSQDLFHVCGMISSHITKLLKSFSSIKNLCLKFNYENDQFILKMFVFLTCFAFRYGHLDQVVKIVSQFEVMSSLRYSNMTVNYPGIVTLYKRFKEVSPQESNLIEFLDHLFPYDPSPFIFELAKFAPMVQLHLSEAFQSTSSGSLNQLFLLAEEKESYKELIALISMRSAHNISELKSIFQYGLQKAQLEKLAHMTAEVSLQLFDSEISQKEFFECVPEYEHKFFSNNGNFSASALEVLYEIVDQNLKINLCNEPEVTHCLKISLSTILSSLSQNDNFITIHNMAQKSTLSFPAILAYLNHILIHNFFDSKYIAEDKVTDITKYFRNIINFDSIPPLPKSNLLIWNTEATGEVKDLTVRSIIDCVSLCTNILLKVILHLSTTDAIFQFDETATSNLSFKILSRFIDLILASLVSVLYLVEVLRDIDIIFLSDIEYLCDDFKNCATQILSNIVEIYQVFGIYRVLRIFIDICSRDLRFVPICSETLAELTKIELIASLISDKQLCFEAFAEFLEFFDDPSLKSFDFLYDFAPSLKDERDQAVVSFNSQEYRNLMRLHGDKSGSISSQKESPELKRLVEPATARKESNLSNISDLTMSTIDTGSEIFVSPKIDESNLFFGQKASNDPQNANNLGPVTPINFKSFQFSNNAQPSVFSTPYMEVQNQFSTQRNSFSTNSNQGSYFEPISPRATNMSLARSNSHYNPENSNNFNYLGNTDKGFHLENRQALDSLKGKQLIKLNNNLNYYRNPPVQNTSRAQSIHVDEFERKI